MPKQESWPRGQITIQQPWVRFRPRGLFENKELNIVFVFDPTVLNVKLILINKKSKPHPANKKYWKMNKSWYKINLYLFFLALLVALLIITTMKIPYVVVIKLFFITVIVEWL